MNVIQMRNSINTQGLIDLIKILPNDITMAEIGSYVGESTRMFMESGKINIMYSIDIWDDELKIYEEIDKRHDFNLVEKKFDEAVKSFNVIKLKMNFEQALKDLPQLDVVYIDANHEYNYVKRDIESSLKKLKRNGIICGHDYNTDSPGVIQAVDEFFGKPDRVFSDSSWMVFLKDLKLVDCTEEYWEFVRILRLDERVSGGFIKTDLITEEQQKEYMKVYSNNYRIALLDGNPVGYVGVIDDDIRICTHPDFQRMGIGKFMLVECKNIWKTSFGKIKLDNEKSIKLFESCGFKKKFYILEQE